MVFTNYRVTVSYNPAENNYGRARVYIASYNEIRNLPFSEVDHVK